MEKANKILRFRIGQESIPLVLNDEERKSSPFNFTIGNAIDCLERKIAASFEGVEDPVSDPEWKDTTYRNNWEYRTINNIIAFFGDRGTGKTSCMRSVVNSCIRRHEDWMFTDEIDPSFFDEKHNILEILVGELYGIFRKDIDKWDQLPQKEQNELRNIQEKFRRVKSALRYLGQTEIVDDNESEIDSLRHLNEGGKLRSLLKDLVSGILKYHDKKLMVISIDDLDLNIRYSYYMMENIRKYLIMPEVTIIIAARYSQLFDSICLVLKQHYEKIQNRVTDKDISEMAERYLAKMFPLDQRFDMPLPESILNATLIIEDKDGNVTNQNENLMVAEKIPAIIFDRTRFLFYNSVGMPSLIIPRNLRDLRMLVGMLYNMKPYDDQEDGANNQRQFLSYFYQEWLGTLEPEYREFATALTKEEDPAKINRFVINNLNRFFIKDVTEIDYVDEDDDTADSLSASYSREQLLLQNILNPENAYWNVSVGDVVVLLNYVKKLYDSDRTRRLLFFIESYYSITLYRLYNKLTADTDINGLNQDVEQPSTSQRLKATVHAEIPEYFRFVGGSFFSGTGDSFIPSATGDKQGRERRRINGKLLYEEIRNVIKEYENLGDDTVEYPESLTTRLTLCEFFMLTTKGRMNLKVSNDIWRLTNEPLYFKEFGNSIKNLLFDATVPFVNAVYPKFCYDRFNNKIFNIAKKDPNSLLNKMTHLGNRHKTNDTWELMSKAALRNMEILTDLTSWLKNKRDSLRPKGKDILGMLQEFYKLFNTGNVGENEIPVTGYWVKTYHRIADDPASPFYRIDYSIYHLLADALDSLTSNQHHEYEKTSAMSGISLFNAIMQDNLLFEYKENYRINEVISIITRYCEGIDPDSLVSKIKRPVITTNTLMRLLAQIRIENRYDLTNCIDELLQEPYGEHIRTEYNDRQKEYYHGIHMITNEIEELKSNQSIITEKLDSFSSSLSQYQKDKSEAEEKQKSLLRDRTAGNLIISDLKNTLNDRSTKLEESEKLIASIQEAQIRLESLSTQIDNTNTEIEGISSKIEDCRKELTLLRNQQRSLTQRIRTRERKRNQLEEDMQQLAYNMAYPISIQL